MVEKKASAAKTATKKPATKKATSKKVLETSTLDLSVENIGFRAGDVYNTLAAAGTALYVEEIAKAANISIEDTFLGIGWLAKEGKLKGEGDKVVLA
ncbi:MAG: winged helix-turn-helix domain-containing protein [Prevotella sp.]|nr:winged helix-turn-helix domain-containing protein [Prevotellaceae bacterium]MDY3935473.1 winged helix-turn-helix domain-containing protein [Prevotella sp.]